MLGLDQLGIMPANAVLLNAGRGEVVATEVLLSLCEQRPDINLVLDVWEDEPCFPANLASHCRIATPHIAGYSADGKLTGLRMVASELAAFLNVSLLPFAAPSSMVDSADILRDGENEVDFIRNAVTAVYDVMEDDKRFRGILASSERGQAFDLLRKNYPVRRELAYSPLITTNPKFSAVLKALQSGR